MWALRRRSLNGIWRMENTAAWLDHNQPADGYLRAIAKHQVGYFGICMHAIDLFASQRALKKAHGPPSTKGRKINREWTEATLSL
jgi:uncharacterized RmlC-like cupin family protein